MLEVSSVCKHSPSFQGMVFIVSMYKHLPLITQVISGTFKQLGILLQQVDVIRINGYEIPRELTEKMFRITHLVGVRCRYDSCSKANVIGDQVQP